MTGHLQPTLAVAIPTFNRAAILDDALWNIGPQIQRSYPKVVCYVIDNASTDDTARVVEKHQQLWPGIRYARNQENVGLIRNIARGIELPDARWVWLLGDDDVPMPWSVRDLLCDIERVENSGPDIAFLLLNGAKVEGDGRLQTSSWRYSGRAQETLTVYDRGIEVVEEGVHSMAWLSKLVVNRSRWSAERFRELYRDSDLYTFVRVLLESAHAGRSAYTKKLYVMATDRGSRSYYMSKTAVARVQEFPEIEGFVTQAAGSGNAGGLLRKSRSKWIRERGAFALKIAVIDDAYADYVHLLRAPLSPFWSERLLMRGIYWITRVPALKYLLRVLYERRLARSQAVTT